jgi:hypothetical protein
MDLGMLPSRSFEKEARAVRKRNEPGELRYRPHYFCYIAILLANRLSQHPLCDRERLGDDLASGLMGRLDMSNLRLRDARSPSQEVDKVRDLMREVTYERRVVAFYDVLGWRSHIRRAGNKASDLSLLRRLILKTARATRIEKGLDLRVTTFSDNVVISQLPRANTPQLLMQLAIWQLGAAINGFLMRGGVTIGDLVHEDEAVFGPGLNRAYYLESKIAMYPRIVLDPLYMEGFGELGSLCTTEDSVCFINPFRLAFCEHLRGATSTPPEELKKAGLPQPKGAYAQLSNELILSQVADSLREQMKEPMTWKDFRKVTWLYDKVAKQIGWPLSDTIERIPA